MGVGGEMTSLKNHPLDLGQVCQARHDFITYFVYLTGLLFFRNTISMVTICLVSCDLTTSRVVFFHISFSSCVDSYCDGPYSIPSFYRYGEGIACGHARSYLGVTPGEQTTKQKLKRNTTKISLTPKTSGLG